MLRRLRAWLRRSFAGRGDVAFAVEACTGWRYVTEELAAAGIAAHLAEPAETAAARGKKRRAKTDRSDSRLLRELLATGRLPACWIPPAHVLECRALLQTYQDLRVEHTAWVGGPRPAHRCPGHRTDGRAPGGPVAAVELARAAPAARRHGAGRRGGRAARRAWDHRRGRPSRGARGSRRHADRGTAGLGRGPRARHDGRRAPVHRPRGRAGLARARAGRRGDRRAHRRQPDPRRLDWGHRHARRVGGGQRGRRARPRDCGRRSGPERRGGDQRRPRRRGPPCRRGRLPAPGAHHVRAGRLGRALPRQAGDLEWPSEPPAPRGGHRADPGRALDVGCGEGADAIWLARKGWQVTAVDIATTALARAAAHAAAAGPQIAARIDWTHADLRLQPPAEGAYDLVSSQFTHLPGQARRDLFARLAAAVAPGGTLLIVGHHPSDLRTTAHRKHFPDMMFTAEQVASSLDPTRWEVLAAEARPRAVVDPEQRDIVIHDAVLVARRHT